MTDFNYYVIRKKELNQCEGILREVFPIENQIKFFRHSFLSDSYVCFVVGNKGSGKTTLANQMLKTTNWNPLRSLVFPNVIVRVDGFSVSKEIGRENNNPLKVHEEIRKAFELVQAGSFPRYDKRDKKKNEIVENLNKFIFDGLQKIDNGHKKEIQEAAAKGLTPLVVALIAWVTNNPSLPLTFALFQDFINKVAIKGLDLAGETIYSLYLEWKNQNEKDLITLKNYHEDVRSSFHKDIREISYQEDKRIAVLFDDVDMISDNMNNLGDIIKSSEGRIFWVLVGKEGRLLAFRNEWSGFIKSTFIEAKPFTVNDIKMDMMKGQSLKRRLIIDEIEKNAVALHKYTNGNPELASIFLKLWNESDDRDRQLFETYFVEKQEKSLTKAIEVIIERLETRNDREFGYISMLFFLGVLSGNIGNLLYRDHTYIEHEILGMIDRVSYKRIQEDGFIYEDNGHYTMQKIWDKHLGELLEKDSFREKYKLVLENANHIAMNCLEKKQEKIPHSEASRDQKIKHETWVRFEFARCYHNLWCDKERAWQDTLWILAIAWKYHPKVYSDFMQVIQKISSTISLNKKEVGSLQDLTTKSRGTKRKPKAFEVFEAYLDSDPYIQEIIGLTQKRLPKNISASKETIELDNKKFGGDDFRRKENILSFDNKDTYLISLAEISELIKNKEYQVAREKIDHAVDDPNHLYRNHFLCKRGDSYRAEKKFDVANEIYSKLLVLLEKKFNEKNSRFDEKDADVCLELGRGFYAMYLESSNKEFEIVSIWLKNAEICLKYSMELDRYGPRMELAEIKKGKLQWGEAEKYYRDVTRSFPKEVAAWEGAGEASIMQGLYSRALGYYNEAYKLNPDSPRIILNRAYLFCRDNDKDLARDCLRQIRNQSSSDLYEIAATEAIMAWVDNDDLDENSPVVTALRDWVGINPEKSKQIHQDRFFEYVRSQPMYINFFKRVDDGIVGDSSVDSSNINDTFSVL